AIRPCVASPPRWGRPGREREACDGRGGQPPCPFPGDRRSSGSLWFRARRVRSFIREIHMSALRSVLSWFRSGQRRPKPATTRRGLNGPRHDRLWLEALEVRDVPSGAHPTLHRFGPPNGVAPLGTAGPTGLTPAQVRHAYGFDQITFAGGVVGDGAGQTIAIVDAFNDPNIANDLHQFDLSFGLPDPVFTKVNQTGGSTLPAADAGWASEIALDVEWAHAIAPRATILLVEANDNSLGNLFAAVDF